MYSKKSFIMLCFVLILTVFTCSCGDVIVDPKWVIGVKGAEKAVFSSIDYVNIHEVTVTVKKEQQDDSILEEKWQGVCLKDVLGYLGITEYSSITLISKEGISIAYTPDITNDTSTILATKLNGRDLDDENGYVQAVAGNQPENLWVTKLSKIIVNK